MSWIEVISYEKAKGRLKQLYDRIKGPDNNVDNIMLAHSLRPHSMTGHMTLYKNVIHHSSNELAKWYLELVGVYVSQLNDCDYCVLHHAQGLRRLLNDEPLFRKLYTEIQQKGIPSHLDIKYQAGLTYAHKLTLSPTDMQEADIQTLRSKGFSDGEILELNQVSSYFNYANRTVLGLGINTEGDILGLSPNDSNDEENWGHS